MTSSSSGRLALISLSSQRATRLAPAPVQSQHQVGGQAFAQGMLSNEPLQLPRELGMPAQRQVGVDAFLDRGQP